MQIKVDLPEASQLGIHFKFGKSVMLQFLDEAVEGPVTKMDRVREKAVLLAGLESQPLDLKARAQLLCYDYCPRKQTKSASATKGLSLAGQGLTYFCHFALKYPLCD